MGNPKKRLIEFLNHFEVYLGAALLMVIMILLTIQVITRYIFGKSFTWTEELSTILFVWSIYLGIVASVLSRKQVRIDAFADNLPFKIKRAVLIFEHIITIIFCGVMIKPIISVITNLLKRDARTTLLSLPVGVMYMIIPFCLALMVIRLIEEIYRLTKENESNLGKSKPTLDLAAYEREYEEKQRALASEKKKGDADP